ncbi:MAG: phosphoadenylyl-sulfate reductase [Verrucomicrobiae bacterium]|nr:phosphoadenylyl-sulfate reductase [Verrucomicrobiae bacterium]
MIANPPSLTEAWTDAELAAANAGLAHKSASERVAWAREVFGEGLALSTSFGVQAAVMLHLATQIDPRMPVVFVDTGYLFPETYRFADRLTRQLGLNLKKYQGLSSPAEQEALRGKLWEQGKDELEEYNLVRKVEPMDRALKELKATAWLAGLRRDQGSTREFLPILKRQNRMIKVHPIIDWSERDVYKYLTENDLPYHPLWEEGYVSVGDWHSSAPLTAGMRAEDTRFNGMKRECGLHELSGRVDFQI